VAASSTPTATPSSPTATPTPSNTPTVTTTPTGAGISLAPAATQIAFVGNVLPVSIVITAGSQSVDSAQAYLSYDPTTFAVTDQNGNPVTSVTMGTALP